MPAPRMSLILPCFNAAETLREHLPELKNHISQSGIDCELIVVDDGSTEPSLLADLAIQYGFRLIVHEKNKGKGAAVRTGMQHATGDVLIFTDCDIPFGYDSPLAVYHSLINGPAEIAIAHRKLSGYRQSGSMLRNLGSAVFGLAVKLIFLRDLGDTQCGLKGFKRQTARYIFERARLNGFSADVEWLVLGLSRGAEIVKVPALLRHSGKSSVSLLRHSLPMLRDVLRVRWWLVSRAYRKISEISAESNPKGQ